MAKDAIKASELVHPDPKNPANWAGKRLVRRTPGDITTGTGQNVTQPAQAPNETPGTPGSQPGTSSAPSGPKPKNEGKKGTTATAAKHMPSQKSK